jgi:hypothetical protein
LGTKDVEKKKKNSFCGAGWGVMGYARKKHNESI